MKFREQTDKELESEAMTHYHYTETNLADDILAIANAS